MHVKFIQSPACCTQCENKPGPFAAVHSSLSGLTPPQIFIYSLRLHWIYLYILKKLKNK